MSISDFKHVSLIKYWSVVMLEKDWFGEMRNLINMNDKTHCKNSA